LSESRNYIQLKISGLTDIGVSRHLNEDNFLFGAVSSKDFRDWNDNALFSMDDYGIVLAVADGVGGSPNGEVASALAITAVKEYFSNYLTRKPISQLEIKLFLEKAVFYAHKRIIDYTENSKSSEIGTTIIINWIINQRNYIIWSGDSRAYLYDKDDNLNLLTFDHSQIWELVKRGIISQKEIGRHPLRNVITQCLGMKRFPPKPDQMVYDLKAGDKILVCSDGLNSMLDDVEIRSLFREFWNPEVLSKKLIDEANSAGGKDNITVVVAEVI
jgi:PPM family protein phosphatase